MKTKLLAWFSFLPALLSAAPVVDIATIAGKTQAEVAAVLGAADSVSTVKGGERAHYAKGDTEIVFVKGKADWITISALGDVPFNSKALEALGIKDSPPTFGNQHVLRWNGLPGLLEVSIFPRTKNCDYAYIEVSTRPE